METNEILPSPEAASALYPGIYLKSVKPEALNNTALAAKLGICRTTLWRFMNGERRLDPQVATILGQITDTPAREWLVMQLEHDVAKCSCEADLAECRG